MAINVEVKKNQNENNANIIRRFTKRIRNSGVVNRMKGLRYFEREPSYLLRKQDRLERIERAEKTEQLQKLGKIASRNSR